MITNVVPRFYETQRIIIQYNNNNKNTVCVLSSLLRYFMDFSFITLT